MLDQPIYTRALLSLTAGVLILSTSCTVSDVVPNNKSVVVPPPLAEEYLLDQAQHIEAIFYEEGRMRFRLLAQTVTRKETPTGLIIEFPEGFHLYLYYDTGGFAGFLTARYGVLLPDHQKMIARGHVVFLNDKGERLDTEELIADKQADKIYSYTHVRLRTAEGIIEGEGFESDWLLKNYKIKQPRGTLRLPEYTLPTTAPHANEQGNP